MTAASQPRSRSAQMSSASRDAARRDRPARSVSAEHALVQREVGPSSVPSRAIDVTRNRGAPASSSAGSASSSSGPSSVQPSHHHVAAAHVDRHDDVLGDTPRTRALDERRVGAPPPCRGSRGGAGSSTAPMPRACAARRPPATGIATAWQIVGHDLAVVALAERRVQVHDVQPARALLLEPRRRPRPGRRRTTVSASGSPRSRRTARPPRRSIAGMTIIAARPPSRIARTRAARRRRTSPGGTAWRRRCRARRPRRTAARARSRPIVVRRPTSGAYECTK